MLIDGLTSVRVAASRVAGLSFRFLAQNFCVFGQKAALHEHRQGSLSRFA